MSDTALPPPEHELRFRVELEDDSIKNTELGSGFSRPDSTTRMRILDLQDGSTIEHYEASNSAGYLDFEITSAQPLEDGNALLVLHTAFHPSNGWTFANATITYETEREAEHAMTITGTPRGSPFKTYVVWTLEQNESLSAGLPSEVQLAAVVQHHGIIKCTVDVKARLNSSLRLGRYLRSKSKGSGVGGIYLDPAKLQGRLTEFKIDWGAGETYKKLLAGLTGEVDGAVVNFGQSVISS
ncbi:hypothetical protein K440DRAFT_605489 [Wilcoxina mikolae CBS 423.85]|nr:hypothetical protein K440DRAFT_605489 [Wilcoxina mikolae CBS 423.85]